MADSFGTNKNKRVSYDEMSKSFHSESFLEIIKRLENARTKSVVTINRSEQAKLDFLQRQIDTNRHIFNRMNNHLVKEHRDTLKDHVAHMRVLKKVAKERTDVTKSDDVERYGIYGPENVRKFDLLNKIESETKELNLPARRRRRAFALLEKRNKTVVFDRNLDRDDFFKQIRGYNSRLTTPNVEESHLDAYGHARFILPPLSVNKSMVTLTLSNSQISDKESAKSSEKSTDKSVFVTHISSHPSLNTDTSKSDDV